MILRRLANAIRSQNWFTVIIEIMIVVIGIFIGLQVTEWNNDRKANNQSRQFLVQLNFDIESSIASMKLAVKEHEVFIKNGKAALRFLNREDIFVKHQAEVEYALQKMHENPKPQLLHGNLYTLMTGGGWLTITDDDAQLQLRHLAGRLGNKIDIYRDIENRITESTALHRQLIGFSIPNDPDVLVSFNINDLQNSTNFKVAMQNSVVFHWWAVRLLNFMISTLEQYKSERLTKEK